MNRFLLVALVCGTLGCNRKAEPKPPQSAEEAFARVTQAARSGKLEQCYDLLDKGSRWSLMSIQRDQTQICRLIQTRYPPELRARELKRCQPASQAGEARAFFAALARKHREAFIGPLARAKKITASHGSGGRISLESQGPPLAFCREEPGWTYCGLKKRLDQLKLKASRDLTTVKENVEAY